MQSVDAVYQDKMGRKAVVYPQMKLAFDSTGKYEKSLDVELTLTDNPVSLLQICGIYIVIES